MASRSTNNSMQSMFQESLSSAASLPQLSIPSIAPTASSSSTPGQVVVSSGAAISPDMVALITQTVQAALAAEQAKDPPSGPVVSSPSSTLSSSTPLVGAIGGVPLFSALGSAPSSMSLPGPSSSGRPFSFVVLSFISTFTVPVMSVSSSAMSAASSLFGASRDVAMAGTVQPSLLVDQPFVVGPSFSPVPVKLVSQIVAGKYSQTPLLRTPLGPEKVSVLQSVLIKRVKLKENGWNGTKKLSVITSVRIKRVSVERGFTVHRSEQTAPGQFAA